MAPLVARALAVAGGLVAAGGIAYRWHDLSRWGFWNDEAWVAISTRVDGLSQFLLSLSVTPIGWGALLRPLALLPHPELSLRLLPFLSSVLALWLAWRLGTRLAGHALGGLLAVTLLAFDPVSIQWAKQLKPYATEAVLALATLLAADRVVHDGRGLVWLVAVLTIGATLSNAQLLLAPPVLAAVLAATLRRRDATAARPVITVGVVVGLWDLAWYATLIRPWMTPALHAYYLDGGYLPASAGVAAIATATSAAFDRLFVPGLGVHGTWIAAVALGVLLVVPRTRMTAVAVTLLVVQLVALALLEIVPLGIARTSLFLTTVVLVLTGAAAARLALLTRPPALAAIPLLLLGAIVFRDRPWAGMGLVPRPEDVGPLIRRVEDRRGADDRVLLYRRTQFVWAYYQTPTPVLIPSDAVTVGWLPRLDDPRVVLVDRDTIQPALERALAEAAQVWFVGSRFAGTDQTRIDYTLRTTGNVVERLPGERALLLRATRR